MDGKPKIQKPITAKGFMIAMQEIKNEQEFETEVCHSLMDKLLCRTLVSLGYGDGVKVYESTSKWYA